MNVTIRTTYDDATTYEFSYVTGGTITFNELMEDSGETRRIAILQNNKPTAENAFNDLFRDNSLNGLTSVQLIADGNILRTYTPKLATYALIESNGGFAEELKLEL